MLIRNFEMPWRKVYEAYSAAGWAVSVVFLFALSFSADIPAAPIGYLILISMVFLAYNLSHALAIWRLKFNLSGKGIWFLKQSELRAIMERANKGFWLGKGFDWSSVHTQRLYEIKRSDPQDLYPPRWMMRVMEKLTGQKTGAMTDNPIGAPWIHGVEPIEKDIEIPVENFVGNVFIVGANRTGKTLLIILMLAFIIVRGYKVIMIDPKSDKQVSRAMKYFCKLANRSRDYVFFDLGFPSLSCRLDFLKNYTKPSDIAARISMNQSSDPRNKPFKDYGWLVMNAIALGMHEVGEKPDLIRIRSYVKSGVAPLLLKVAVAYFDRVLPATWESDVKTYAISAASERARAQGKQVAIQDFVPRRSLNSLLGYYSDVLKPTDHTNEAIEALKDIHTHDAAHHSKMILTLLPLLDKLTTGELGPLLTPKPSDIQDTRPITDLASLLRSNSVVYLGLNSMADKMIADAVGSMAVADLAAYAAMTYNYETVGQSRDYKFIIIDELHNVVSEPAVELTARGGGAGFITIGATQTVADLEEKLGSEAAARMILGNFNSLIALRVKDPVTQKYVAEQLGRSPVHMKQVIHGSTSSTEKNLAHFTGSVQERMSETLEDMIPPEVIGAIPNWQCIATFVGGRTVKIRYPIVELQEVA